MSSSTTTPAQILVITTVQEGTYYHESIPTATAALLKSQSNSAAFTFTVSATPSPYFSSVSSLLRYDAICFLHTMADILNESEMQNLMSYCARSDKGVIGIQSAAYTSIFGASFTYHPDECKGCVYKPSEQKGEEGHVTMRQWPERREIVDEWYNFHVDPLSVEGNVCLLAVDEGSYRDEGLEKGEREALGLHAIAWYRERKSGDGEGVRCRVWYTSLGHTHEIWGDEAFMRQVLDGMAWTVGRM
jgi:type 1 glutamine amidotransferase